MPYWHPLAKVTSGAYADFRATQFCFPGLSRAIEKTMKLINAGAVNVEADRQRTGLAEGNRPQASLRNPTLQRRPSDQHLEKL
jgi:hypothetical protein